ncbi:hypothetical protein PZH37_19500, partial [[Eubacterium] siraeum]|nr:hypothetical protein [[Eubacterium] siraeum]
NRRRRYFYHGSTSLRSLHSLYVFNADYTGRDTDKSNFPSDDPDKKSVQPHFTVKQSAVFHLTRLSVRLHFPVTLAIHGLCTYASLSV